MDWLVILCNFAIIHSEYCVLFVKLPVESGRDLEPNVSMQSLRTSKIWQNMQQAMKYNLTNGDLMQTFCNVFHNHNKVLWVVNKLGNHQFWHCDEFWWSWGNRQKLYTFHISEHVQNDSRRKEIKNIYSLKRLNKKVGIEQAVGKTLYFQSKLGCK